MNTEKARDPVAVLGHAINEGCVLHGPDGSDLDATVKCAPGTLDSLAEQGYVLVKRDLFLNLREVAINSGGIEKGGNYDQLLLAAIQEQGR